MKAAVFSAKKYDREFLRAENGLRRQKEQGVAVIAALNTRSVFDRNLSALEA